MLHPTPSFSLLAVVAFVMLAVSGCHSTTVTTYQNENAAEQGEYTVVDPPRADDSKDVVRSELDALILELTSSDSTVAISKMQILFNAANDTASNVATEAKFVADGVAANSKDERTRRFAQEYLILAAVRDGEADAVVGKRLSEYFHAHQANMAPIKLYQRIADQFVNAGSGTRALALLDHGIRTCASHPNVSTLRNHRRMTQQTIMLMGHTRTVSRTLPPRRPDTSGVGALKVKEKYKKYVDLRPNIAGRTLLGRSVTSSDLRGKWVYVHFWATWCKACRSATPGIVRLKRKYESQGVKFVGVNMDSDHKAAAEFVKQHGLDWPHIVQGEGGWNSPLARSLGVSSIPVSMFLSPTGSVVAADQPGQMEDQMDFRLGFAEGLEKGVKKGLERLRSQQLRK